MKTHTDVAPWSQRENKVAVSHRSLAPELRKVLATHLVAQERGSQLKEGHRREEVKAGREPWCWHLRDASSSAPALISNAISRFLLCPKFLPFVKSELCQSGCET